MSRRRFGPVLAAICVFLSGAASAETRKLCTLAVEVPSARTLIEDGACDTRVSPASTFKIAISLMGFDAGILTAPDSPEWPFREGYVDWRPAWRQAATPARWMTESVVWYSQQITQRLGADRFAAYVDAFDYGNEDVSGEPGKGNGLTSAWLSSSLAISPAEQVDFLRRMLAGALPVRGEAVRNTVAITDLGLKGDGWRVHGKTGAGRRLAVDGGSGRPFGWFVGWAEKDGRTLVFARLIEDSERQKVPAGFRARDGLFADLFGPGGPLD